MKKQKYFYGLEDQEIYYEDDLEQAFSDALDEICSDKPVTITIVEMGVDKNNRERWCVEYQGEPECDGCSEKSYIGKSHICKHLGWTLWPTGAEWEYNTADNIIKDGYQYLDASKIKKISGRLKRVKP